MLKIEFWARFGMVQKWVEITSPNGGGYWLMFIDHLFQGQFVNYDGKWNLRMHRKDHFFTADDEYVIVQLIVEKLRTENCAQVGSNQLPGPIGIHHNEPG